MIACLVGSQQEANGPSPSPVAPVADIFATLQVIEENMFGLL